MLWAAGTGQVPGAGPPLHQAPPQYSHSQTHPVSQPGTRRTGGLLMLPSGKSGTQAFKAGPSVPGLGAGRGSPRERGNMMSKDPTPDP